VANLLDLVAEQQVLRRKSQTWQDTEAVVLQGSAVPKSLAVGEAAEASSTPLDHPVVGFLELRS